MLNPVEKTVSVQIPTSVISSIEFPRMPIVEDILADIYTSIDTEDGVELGDDALRYVSSAIFLPLVIDNMISYDLDFKQACERAKPDIQKSIDETNAQFIMLKAFGLIEPIKILLAEILKPVMSIVKKDNSDKPDDFFPVSITVSPKLAFGLKCANILDIAEKLMQNQEIMDSVCNKIIYPLIEGSLQALIDEKTLQESKDELSGDVKEVVNDSCESLVLKALLSEILTKAINEDLSFLKAAENYSADELYEIGIKALSNTEDISEHVDSIKEMFEKFSKLGD